MQRTSLQPLRPPAGSTWQKWSQVLAGREVRRPLPNGREQVGVVLHKVVYFPMLPTAPAAHDKYDRYTVRTAAGSEHIRSYVMRSAQWDLALGPGCVRTESLGVAPAQSGRRPAEG
jgi:hypothetical protein